MDNPPIKMAANVAAMVFLVSFMVYLLNQVSVRLVIISLESLTVRVITDYALAAFRAANSAAGKL
jgi:hypothetical protein